jgi:ribosomal protein S18 acetylase RimI-like enzyme
MSSPALLTNPLDHPIWFALTSTHGAISQGNAIVRRYPPAIAPFAALSELSPECFNTLHALMSRSEHAVLFTLEPVNAGEGFKTVLAATGEQMIGTPAETAISAEVVRLGVDDAPAMVGLAELTKPGPFTLRTHELGTFLGIKVDGRLVAMTGERMKPAKYTEITAVCVHPEYRGRGYAQMLLSAISRQIVARGETPFLHVFSDNAAAIALYRRQGMKTRRRIHVTVLRHAESETLQST